MLIIIIVIIGVLIETLLIGNTIITIKMLDNEQVYDKEFWTEEGIK